MMFHVGQKVALIDESGWHRPLLSWITYPKIGPVYHIRNVLHDDDGVVCIRVAEIKNKVGVSIDTGKRAEAFFRASRFRPVVERKTNISIFTEILRRATKPTKVRA